MNVFSGLAGIAGVLGARELFLMKDWMGNKRKYYDMAEIAARRSGKPLLVVGRPRGRDHGCGDVCIDLNGCPECLEKGVTGDIRDMSMFADKKFGAAFVGSVLECLPSGIERAVGELYRVADDVFVQHIFDSSISSRYHPETQATIYAAPPITPWVEYSYHRDGIQRVVLPNAKRIDNVKMADAVNAAAATAEKLCRNSGVPKEVAIRAVASKVVRLLAQKR